MEDKYTFTEFCEIIDALLGENGCPWDKAQTHASLMPHLLEECYEVLDAVKRQDMGNLCEELGDVLLQVVLNAKIAENEKHFTLDDVTTTVSQKMINRHPHIFGRTNVKDADEVLDNWERIKKAEKGYSKHTDALKSVPDILPALLKALKVQKSAQKSGLMPKESHDSAVSDVDWLCEQTADFKTKLIQDMLSEAEISVLIGDALFTIVTISRKLQINPEFSLTNAVERFINRFEQIESVIKTHE